ncbi:MAG: RNA methyltransferase, partial [Fibrobacter sp.]|nr:RNA methyltransferase [Fibrobacter sp.]
MSEEENKPKRTVRMTLDRKFGVSEAPERRPRRNDDERGSFGDKPFNRGDRRFDRDDRRFDRGDRRFDRGERRFDRDENREDRPANREERRFGDRPFNRDRRPHRFGDKPFNRNRRDAVTNAPVYRQRPEQKESVDENLDEAALEARAAQIETVEDSAATPPWFKRLIACTTEKGREREGKFLGEGVHVVEELVKHHREIVISIYAVEGFENEPLIEAINEAEITLHTLTEEQMKRLSSTVTSQGIVAYCNIA